MLLQEQAAASPQVLPYAFVSVFYLLDTIPAQVLTVRVVRGYANELRDNMW
jgi:hypothetical protein